MKIAITADLHLGNKTQNPERFNVLLDIFKYLKETQISNLIIAGDCFDQSNSSVNLLEEAFSLIQNDQLRIWLLPGNHDQQLRQSQFNNEQITLIEDTQIIKFGSRKFLFIPYNDQKTIGSEIGRFSEELKNQPWILIGHGDLSSNNKLQTEYEKGIYMPLSSRDIEIFQPRLVIMGHIHMQYSTDFFHYPGSPCGLDITETGKRRFLILDTNSLAVESVFVKTEVIFLNEKVLVFPSENEKTIIKTKLDQIINQFDSEEIKKINIRVSLYGYSIDRNAANKTAKEYFSVDRKVKNFEIKITDLLFAQTDQIRQLISNKVRGEIANIELGKYELIREKIIEQSLKIIFNGK